MSSVYTLERKNLEGCNTCKDASNDGTNSCEKVSEGPRTGKTIGTTSSDTNVR